MATVAVGQNLKCGREKCQQSFQAKKRNQVFCSTACQMSDWKERHPRFDAEDPQSIAMIGEQIRKLGLRHKGVRALWSVFASELAKKQARDRHKRLASKRK